MDEKMTSVVEPIEHMVDGLTVEAVFGKPTHENNVTIIPVAQVGYGFGYGQGYGRAPNGTTNGEQHPAKTAEGGGGGGGGGGSAVPRGYLRITSEGVVFEPIVDQARISLAGIAFAAWTVFWIALTIRALAKVFTKGRK